MRHFIIKYSKFLFLTIFLTLLSGSLVAKKSHITMGMPLEPPHLDPTAGAAAAIDEIVYANIFEGLTRINQNAEILPALAESWHISSDGLKYTFKLRSNVRFHDGSIFDSNDVIFSIKRATAKDSTNAQKSLFTVIESVSKKGPYFVIINLKKPTGNFLFNMGWGCLLYTSPSPRDRG